MFNKADIAVGLSASLSGRFRTLGQQALNGIRLWQSYINVQGGVALRNGAKRSVRLIWYDDRSKISCTRMNVLKLLREDHIDILLGPYSSSLTLAAAATAEEFKKVLWNHGGSSDEIFHRGWRYVVGIPSPASDYLRTLPHWLVGAYPALRRICVLYSERGIFGRQVARGILESAATNASQSVELVPIKSPVENYDTILRTLCDIDPEVVVLAVAFPDEVMITRIRERWPATVRVVAGVAAGVGAFSTELGETANRVLGPSQWEPGVTFPGTIGPTSDWFLDSFQRQFGQPPEYVAAGSFATGLVLTECIRRSASFDDEELRSTASGLDCSTFYGRFRIESRTGIQTGHRMLLIRWEGGRKVVLTSQPDRGNAVH